eukprot:gene10901-11055_t
MGDTQLADAVQVFKGLQQEVQTLSQTRQQLMQQISESEAVKEELDLLDEDATVYKLIGPAMIKQDLVEAKTNVSKRLEYIQAEMKRITDRISTLDGKGKDQQALIMKLQAKQQQAVSAS